MEHADIIVITYNSLRFLPSFFHFVKNKTRYPFHLFVFDNFSTDGSRAYLKRLQQADSIRGRLRLTFNPENLGVAKVWNMGIGLCSGKYLVFLNPDVKLTDGWLEKMVRCAERHPKAGIVGVKVLNYDGTICHAGRQEKVRGCEEEDGPDKYAAEAEVQSIQGSCFLVRRSIVPVVGKFDERFFVYGEEDDYCLRTRNAGYTVMYCPVRIYHHREGSSVSPERRRSLRLQSREQFIRKWGPGNNRERRI